MTRGVASSGGSGCLLVGRAGQRAGERVHHHASGVSIRHNIDHDYDDDDDNGDDVELLSVEAGAPSNRGGVRGESGHC